MSPVELRRILSEWRLRVQRVKDILQPPTWDETEWRRFSQALALLVRDHGRSWIIDPNVYWDLRWKLQDGGDLVCQVEHVPNEKTSLVVAQTGGFAAEAGSYTWLWAEFDLEGNFSRDPYWVDGAWKDALTTLLLPFDRQSSYMLAGRTATPDSLLLQEGARPNDGQYSLALPAGFGTENTPAPTQAESAPSNEIPPETPASTPEPPPVGPSAEIPVSEPAPSPIVVEAPISDPILSEPAASDSSSVPATMPEKISPVGDHDGELARLCRKLARVRHFRSARKFQPRSYYRELPVKTSALPR